MKDEKNIFDTQVSFFTNCRKTTGKDYLLWDVLTSKEISAKYLKTIEAIRAEPDKDKRKILKEKQAPGFTPAGLFNPGERNAAGLKQHSGFIPFDIDGLKDQLEAESMRAKVSKCINVAYAGLSISGRGLWGLVPIAYPARHREHFIFMKKVFASWGIKLDPAGEDVPRFRFYSFDGNAYFNPLAEPLRRYWNKGNAFKGQNKAHTDGQVDENIKYKVETCLDIIGLLGSDLTGNYLQWFYLGCSFAKEFGEDGREYYHRLSENYPGYTPDETDREFDKALKYEPGYSKIYIDKFLGLCRDAGITYRDKPPKKGSPREDFADVEIPV
jgi:hypothetical protein